MLLPIATLSMNCWGAWGNQSYRPKAAGSIPSGSEFGCGISQVSHEGFLYLLQQLGHPDWVRVQRSIMCLQQIGFLIDEAGLKLITYPKTTVSSCSSCLSADSAVCTITTVPCSAGDWTHAFVSFRQSTKWSITQLLVVGALVSHLFNNLPF